MPAYGFTIKGSFDEVTRLPEVVDHAGNVTGFLLPDGRTVQLIATLEVCSPSGDSFEYFTKTADMEKLGFSMLDYSALTFTPKE